MDASQKLRMVLDYLPCEACLAQPVEDQELLCSICHRLHRQVAVRVTTRTTVILERPTVAPVPVVIPPAVPLVEAPPPEPERVPEAVPPLPPEIITEPYLEPAEPVPVVELQEEPEPVAAPLVAPEPEPEPEPQFDDVASFAPTEDSFEVVRGEPQIVDESYEVVRDERVPPASPPSEPAVLSESDEIESDYVFREPEPEPEPAAVEESDTWTPTEEILVEEERPVEEPSRWAPPAEEIFPDDDSRTFTPLREEEVVSAEIVEETPEAPIETEEVFLAEVIEDDAPTTPAIDLYRLHGFAQVHEVALRDVGIDSIASLAGHDPVELAGRAGLHADALVPWVQVADLVQEVGVPIDSAIALVAAGIPGPRGLREMEEQQILDRVEASGGLRLSGRDIKRWKRRA